MTDPIADLERLVELRQDIRDMIGEGHTEALADFRSACIRFDFASILARLRELEMDSANYRGRCSECKASCMDMLTDDHCAQCTFISMEGDFAEYEHATRQRIAELEAENQRLRECLPSPDMMSGWDDPGAPDDVLVEIGAVCSLRGVEMPDHVREAWRRRGETD